MTLYVAPDPTGNTVILTAKETGEVCVELEALCTANLFPSPRFLAMNGLGNHFESYRLEVARDVAEAADAIDNRQERMSFLLRWYAAHYKQFKGRWRRSLDFGEIAHDGELPARAFRSVQPSLI